MLDRDQDPESRLALTLGVTLSISGLSCFFVAGSLLAFPLIPTADAEPGWLGRVIFFILTALAAGLGLVLGEIGWLVAASRFVSRERLQSFVSSPRMHRRWLLGSKRWWMLRLYP